MSIKKTKAKQEKPSPARPPPPPPPSPPKVWAVVTRDPNIYIVGKSPDFVTTYHTEMTALPMLQPAMMFRQGTTIRFEKLDGFLEYFFVPINGALAYGQLDEPYVTHYLTYIGLGSQNPGPPGPPKE